MRRIRIKLNRIASLPERKRVGRKIMADLGIKLQMGWNPFTERIAPKAYALMFETLDRFLAVKSKDSRDDTIRGYTSYVKIFKKWLLEHGFDEASYVCSFAESDAIDFMDDRDLAVSARTFNNSILFFPRPLQLDDRTQIHQGEPVYGRQTQAETPYPETPPPVHS